MTKVLYVEDNDDNVYMMRMQFELLDGFEFLTAEDGEAGYAKAKAELPDIILMDLDLPVLNGWEVTRRLKDDAATRHIPVIALTAHAMAARASRRLRPAATSSIPSLLISSGCWKRSILSLGAAVHATNCRLTCSQSLPAAALCPH